MVVARFAIDPVIAANSIYQIVAKTTDQYVIACSTVNLVIAIASVNPNRATDGTNADAIVSAQSVDPNTAVGTDYQRSQRIAIRSHDDCSPIIDWSHNDSLPTWTADINDVLTVLNESVLCRVADSQDNVAIGDDWDWQAVAVNSRVIAEFIYISLGAEQILAGFQWRCDDKCAQLQRLNSDVDVRFRCRGNCRD